MTIVAKAFEIVTTTRFHEKEKNKIFVTSWHTRFRIYKGKKKFVKLAANHLAALSSKVCNESIMTGNVPDIFKVRRITPILLKIEVPMSLRFISR